MGGGGDDEEGGTLGLEETNHLCREPAGEGEIITVGVKGKVQSDKTSFLYC